MRNIVKRQTNLLILVLVASLVFSSCSDNQNNIKNQRVIKVATSEEPTALDPRLVRSLYTVTVMRMLYEGLMRSDSNGELVPAIAERVTISDDKKTYTFHLRDAQWSDGSPLTANDFEQTWKSILSPGFPAPNAYQHYVIKGAKDAKEGRTPTDAVGVKALDPKTLVVELNEPTPYFLELTSCHFYFPVHADMRSRPPNQAPVTVVSNGPFVKKQWKQRDSFAVEKNPHYWDVDNVHIDGVELLVLDESTGLQLYKAGQVHWAGSPLSTIPPDAMAALMDQGKLQIAAGAGTQFFRVNTIKPPFDHPKMRRAFAMAIDRKAIVDHVAQGNQLVAIGFVPPAFGFNDQTYFTDHDTAAARKLMAEALDEMGISKKVLPPIVLRYAFSDRNHKIAQAIQQQWSKTFDTLIVLESSELQVFFDKMRSGDYHVGMGSWYADIRDPINFLEIFKSKDNPTNQTFWEDRDYTALLDASSKEADPASRMKILQDSESKLMSAMPIIPILHSSYNYLKADEIDGVVFSPLGFLDFKDARFTQ